MKVSVIFELDDKIKDNLQTFIEESIKELKKQFGDNVKIFVEKDMEVKVDVAFIVKR